MVYIYIYISISIYIYIHTRTYLSAYARQPARGPWWGEGGRAGSKSWRVCYPSGKRCSAGVVLAHLGAISGLCCPLFGPRWAYVGPILKRCWPIWGLSRGYVAPSWGLGGPMLAHLEAYVGPCWPIFSHKLRKMRKNGNSKKHRKTQGFLMTRGGGGVRRQGRQPLSPSERRDAVRQGHCQLRAPRAPGRIYTYVIMYIYIYI